VLNLIRGKGSNKLAQVGAAMAQRPYARRGVPVASEAIRVVLIDDHKMVREGLRVLLRGAPDIVVVGEADNGARGLQVALELKPDAVVMDLDMPTRDGLSAMHDLAEALPETRVLILTMYADQDRLLQLLEAGARGYLTKEAAAQDLIDAIRVVASGDVYVRPSAARLLAAAVVPQSTMRTAAGQFNSLSDRERMIVRQLAEGFSGVEIARHLQISTKTVAEYKQRIEEKLGLTHRTDYVRFAIEAGILRA